MEMAEVTEADSRPEMVWVLSTEVLEGQPQCRRCGGISRFGIDCAQYGLLTNQPDDQGGNFGRCGAFATGTCKLVS